MERKSILLAICAVAAAICVAGCQVETALEAKEAVPALEAKAAVPARSLYIDETWEDRSGPLTMMSVRRHIEWDLDAYNALTAAGDPWLELDEEAASELSFEDDTFEQGDAVSSFVQPKVQRHYTGYNALTDVEDPWLK